MTKKNEIATKMSEKFINTWRQRHGSNTGLDSPAAMKAYKQHVKNEAIDKKYAKLASEKGKTPTGKRKWHYYNTHLG